MARQAAHTRENALLFAVVGAHRGDASVPEGRWESLRPPEAAPLTFPPEDWGDLDWDYVVAAADRQGITPLLAKRAEQGRITLPSHVAAHATATYWETHFRNRTLMECLRRILSAAADAALPVMPLKGAALVGWYYATPALRPMSDLDLLVPPGQEARMGAVLQSLGFAAVAYSPPLVGGRHGGAASAEYAAVGTFGGVRVLVEYRSEPLDPAVGSLAAAVPVMVGRLRDHAAQMWARAASVSLDGVPCVRIAPEDLLLHVASHLTTRHAGLRLLWLHDLAAIVAAHGDALDWAYIGARARDLEIENPVGTALAAAHRWLGTPLPAVPIAQWPGRGGALGHRIERRLLATRVDALGTSDLAAAHAGPLQWQPLAIAAARLLAARSLGRAARWMALPRREYMAWWYAAPVATPGGYARAVGFRAAYTALSALAPLAARLRLPGARAGVALLRRMRACTPVASLDA